jgi:hypothetical protein
MDVGALGHKLKRQDETRIKDGLKGKSQFQIELQIRFKIMTCVHDVSIFHEFIKHSIPTTQQAFDFT